MNRREFLFGAVAAGVGGTCVAKSSPPVEKNHASAAPQSGAGRGIKIRFLGSGASRWRPEWAKKNPHIRRQSSVLLEDRVLIDFTHCSFDKMPAGCRPEVLFQTHSHGDHYNPDAAVQSGVKRIYVQESWADGAREEVKAAAAKLSLPAPEVIALPFGRPVEECGLKVTGVPAMHSTSRMTGGVMERASLYLVEKGDARLLYATDTGGISGDAARMIGIDPHITEKNFSRYAECPFVHKPQPLTAFVMEATNADLDEDFRLFVHASIQSVSRIVNMLLANGRFTPPAGQHPYITHLGLKYRGWPSEKIDKILPDPLRAAYDGLELTLG